MRIIWNPAFKQFEAQLASGAGWQTEQQVLKKAGFRTEGPPEWKWLAFRAKVLTKLKEFKLPDLTITTEALEHYNRLKTQEDANQAVLDQLKEAKKNQKKADKQQTGREEYNQDELEHGEFNYVKYAKISQQDELIIQQKYTPLPAAAFCSVCHEPVYYFERQDLPLCLDCEFPEEF